uniref:NADH-ubiquinone oxidoreductase chain 4L n=1 Tax=Linuche unguiculata TaxID=880233 RepID=G9ISJ5_LINUG|nr:NADH dehydrogenase subunit 4L [Linuche unguiculata]
MPIEYLTVAIILFLLSILGIVINRSHLILMIMCIELMLLATSLLFLICSITLANLTGEIFTISILTVAASESAIGLAIMVAFYRIRGSIAIKTISLLKG